MIDIVYNDIKAYIQKDPVGLIISNGAVLVDIGKENFKAARELNEITWDAKYSKAHGEIILVADKYQSIYSRSTYNSKPVPLSDFVSECEDYKLSGTTVIGTKDDYALAFNSKISTLCFNYKENIKKFDKNKEGGVYYFMSINDWDGFERYLKKFIPLDSQDKYITEYNTKNL